MVKRKILTVLGALWFFGLFSLFAEYEINDPVGDFVLQGYVNGDFTQTQSISLYDDYISQGKAVVLDFFFTTCGECNEHVGEYVELYKTYHSTKDFEIIFVDVMSEPGLVIEAWANTHELVGIGNILKEGQDLLSLFSLSASAPYCALIDKNGVLRYKDRFLNSAVTEAFFNNSDWVGIDEVIIPALNATNYPNPFNPSTTIKLTLEKRENVEIKIFNAFGKMVKTLVKSNLEKGVHSFKWDGKNNAGESLASGIYFYKISTESNNLFKKMLLVK